MSNQLHKLFSDINEALCPVPDQSRDNNLELELLASEYHMANAKKKELEDRCAAIKKMLITRLGNTAAITLGDMAISIKEQKRMMLDTEAVKKAIDVSPYMKESSAIYLTVSTIKK